MTIDSAHTRTPTMRTITQDTGLATRRGINNNTSIKSPAANNINNTLGDNKKTRISTTATMISTPILTKSNNTHIKTLVIMTS